jgi:hypothetical protein
MMDKFDEIQRLMLAGDRVGAQKLLAEAMQEAKDAPTSVISMADGVKFKRRGRYVEQVEGKWVQVRKKR